MPRGSIYITIMELGPQTNNGDGLSGANSIIVVYMDPLYRLRKQRLTAVPLWFPQSQTRKRRKTAEQTVPQTFQNPLIKEYTLNHIKFRDPTII